MPFGSVSLLSMTVSAELVNTYNAGNKIRECFLNVIKRGTK